MKNLWLALALIVGSGSILYGNGGAWQTGITETGNASASKNDRHTDVTLENETVKIDLHPDHADVTVQYRMHNSGPKVQQDFFFPVEHWAANPNADGEGKSEDIDHYQISVDGKALKWTNVTGLKKKISPAEQGSIEANQKGSETKEAATEATKDPGQTAEKGSEADKEADEPASEPIWEEELFTIKSWK